ncbi:uncharacterized protein F5147DRAFT_773692 [Suillus discolor]|uniref:Uncharacterized protein n=1 Tax=Suillus discolor TaxID=1912936 RepID=A0A9P7F698_9AGAM|nr:uncharacterized protein F5147DRAFT_773692 [Suillus discolor]KAG2108496.1 hypothetical protein F5147DRAFT_773692 [Suillus discolor]
MSPAGETGTSSTPPRANASEPWGFRHQVKKLRPWIQRDIEQVKECKADAMLQALLQRASSAPETAQPEFLQKCLKAVLPVSLNEYMGPGVENSFYGPFIRTTNIALACLEEIKVDGMGAPVPAVDMICQQNDMPMHQTHQTKKSTRKPDLVILHLDSACAPFQDEMGGKKGKQKNKESVEKDDGKNDEKNDEKRKKKLKAHGHECNDKTKN